MKKLTILTASILFFVSIHAGADESKIIVPADETAEGEMIDADKAEDFFVAEFSEDLTATLRPATVKQ